MLSQVVNGFHFGGLRVASLPFVDVVQLASLGGCVRYTLER